MAYQTNAKCGEQTCPIAIVGIGCRLPGDSSTPSKFWELLENGKSGYSKIPDSRFNADGFLHPQLGRPGSFPGNGGYFICDDLKTLDCAFFGITPREAACIDPQQRQLLETAFECFESSGQTLEGLSGSNTGCFIGNYATDYYLLQSKDPEYPTPYTATGQSPAILSNRLSYVFNLQGPSLTLDTACSSSMYALGLACESLAAGSCTAAVVGGSNLLLSPETYITTTSLGILSPTSQSHSFDDSADGFARGEGVCVLYIKRLEDAIANNDPVRAVIRGISLNADGRTPGMTHPSTEVQSQAIRQAYLNAGLDYSQTGYVECHATGTKTGDPIEVAAVAQVISKGRASGNPLLIGSLKPSIGHCEGASGLASIIKVVLALEKGIIPPTIGLKNPNPDIRWDEWKVRVATQSLDWPQCFAIRRASVNSFGYGGANGHAVLDAYDRPRVGMENGPSVQRNISLAVFSAHDEGVLRRNISNILEKASNYDTIDLCYTLCSRRSRFRHRAFTLLDPASAPISFDRVRIQQGEASSASPKLGFVFTGQGAQWHKMARQLILNDMTFRSVIERLDNVLQGLKPSPQLSIFEALVYTTDPTVVHTAERAQYLSTAVQIALIDTLSRWNIEPSCVIGHSSGEIAASYAAGLLSAPEAIIVAYFRGKAVSLVTNKGAMLAVTISQEEAEQIVKQESGSIVIACINSSTSITLSGNVKSIHEVKAEFDRRSTFNRLLQTDGKAYHSHHMAISAVEDFYTEAVASAVAQLDSTALSWQRPPIRMVSSVTAAEMTKVPNTYWQENLVSTVNFQAALESLLKGPHSPDILLEIGPHPALSSAIKTTAATTRPGLKYRHSLLRNEDSHLSLLKIAGSLFLDGCSVDFSPQFPGDIEQPQVLVDLPSYSWNHESKYWHESTLSHNWRFRIHPRHDLLGSMTETSSFGHSTWRNVLSTANVEWIQGHKVQKHVVLPAAAYLAMAIEAITQRQEREHGKAPEIHITLAKIQFVKPVTFPDESYGVELLSTLVYVNHTCSYSFEVVSVVNRQFFNHFRCEVALSRPQTTGYDAASTLIPMVGAKNHAAEKFYEAFNETGLNFTGSFRSLDAIRTYRNDDRVAAMASLEALDTGESRYAVHPVVLDACLQLAIVAAHKASPEMIQRAFIPESIDEITLAYPTESARRSKLLASGESMKRQLVCDVDAYWEGRTLLHFKSVKLAALDSKRVRSKITPYMRLLWKPDVSLPLNLKSTMITASEANSHDIYTKIFSDLNRAARLSASRSFVNLTLANSAQDTQLQRYLAWLQSIAEITSQHGSPQDAECLVAKGKNITLEGQMLSIIHENLQEIALGKLTALDVFIKEDILSGYYQSGICFTGAYAQLSQMIDLLGHKWPSMDILEVGAGTGGGTRAVLQKLSSGGKLKRYRTYTYTDVTTSFFNAAEKEFEMHEQLRFAKLDIENDPLPQGFARESYDLVIAVNVIHTTRNAQHSLLNVRQLLRPNGKLLLIEITRNEIFLNYILGGLPNYWRGVPDDKPGPFKTTDEWQNLLQSSGYQSPELVAKDSSGISSCILATRLTDSRTLDQTPLNTMLPNGHGPMFFVIYRSNRETYADPITRMLQKIGIEATVMSLSECCVDVGARGLVVAELEGPFLQNITPEELLGLKNIMSNAKLAVLVSSGDLLNGSMPLCSLTFGLTRAMRTEYPSIQLLRVDFDYAYSPPEANAIASIFEHLMAVITDTSSNVAEAEYVVKNGVLYISRLVPDDALNAQFMETHLPLAENSQLLHSTSLILGRAPESSKDVCWKESSYNRSSSQEDFPIRVDKLLITRRNAIDIEATENTSATLMAFVGHSELCADSTTDDARILGLSRMLCGSHQQIPKCHCRVYEQGAIIPALEDLVPYYTAMYCFTKLASFDTEDRILVYVRDFRISLALLLVGRLQNLNIWIAVAASDEAETLRKTVSEDRVILTNFESTPSSASLQFDVVITSEDNAFSVSTQSIVFVGSTGSSGIDKVRERIAAFSHKNIRYSAFDIDEFFMRSPAKAGRFLADVLDAIEQQELPCLPESASFCLSEVREALNVTKHSGQAILSFSLPEKGIQVPFQPLVERYRFRPGVSYLLVGCLGGLGRSLSQWMQQRGAKSFVYLSRSGGKSNSEVTDTLDALRSSGCLVQIVTGDVANRADVDRAIAQAHYPIGGVIQAAMVLDDVFFEQMSVEKLKNVLACKVQGTINLHEALQGKPLDFFLMTSSLSAITGVATQSNYNAACAFQDAFARYRNTNGLPAVSLALGMVLEVGYVSERAHVEHALLRNGLNPIWEHEFLEMIETALKTQVASPSWGDPNAKTHIVTGLEPARLVELTKRGYTGATLLHGDPRFGMILMAARENYKIAEGPLRAGDDEYSGERTALEEVLDRFSKLVFQPVQQIDPKKTPSDYGVDSMIGAEFRNWFYKTFKADLSFLEILSPTVSFEELADRATNLS